MSSGFESISTGIAAHIGKYADAVRIPAGAEMIFTSGTPGLRPDGTLPEDSPAQYLGRGRGRRDAPAQRVMG